MANLNEETSISVDNVAWKCLVFNPVMAAIGKKFKHEEGLADAQHTAFFILRCLVEDMPKMIGRAAFEKKTLVFPSIVILASAAPKSLYKTLYQSLPPFLDQVIERNGLPERTKALTLKYFDSLKEDRDSLVVMFVRDAIFISSPSNVAHLTKHNVGWKEEDIIRQTRLLTLVMCYNVLGMSNMASTFDKSGLEECISTLINSLQSVAGLSFMHVADSVCLMPPRQISLNGRRTQVIEFLKELF